VTSGTYMDVQHASYDPQPILPNFSVDYFLYGAPSLVSEKKYSVKCRYVTRVRSPRKCATFHELIRGADNEAYHVLASMHAHALLTPAPPGMLPDSIAVLSHVAVDGIDAMA
jgi:hypothetical protein